MSVRICNISVRMSLPWMYAVPDVGGITPEEKRGFSKLVLRRKCLSSLHYQHLNQQLRMVFD